MSDSIETQVNAFDYGPNPATKRGTPPAPTAKHHELWQLGARRLRSRSPDSGSDDRATKAAGAKAAE